MKLIQRACAKVFGPLGAGAGAFILALASAISYLTGWLRDAIFARTFGITAETDSYFKAFLIPDTLLTIFITGALLGLVIPLYVKARKISEREAEETFGAFFYILNAFYLGAALLCLIFLDPILQIAFPETPADQVPIMKGITAILIISNFCFALSNFFGHFLLAQKRFFAYSFAPLLYNVGIILGILFGAEEFGIYAPAWGALLGAIFHLIIRFIDFLFSGERFRFSFDFKNPYFRELLWSMWPKVISLLAIQIGFYLFARLGDGVLGAGNYSAFQYARNLQSFAVSLFGISLATAVFPFLADFVAERKMQHFIYRLEKSLRQILFMALPSAVGIILIAPEVVNIVYGDHESNSLIVTALIPLAIAIPFESMNHLLVRSFHVLKNTFLPMIASLIFLGTLIALSFGLVQYFGFGVSAFSIAYGTGYIFQIAFLLFWLPRFSVAFPWKEFIPRFARTMLMTLFMGGLVILVLYTNSERSLLIRFVLAVTVGSFTYFLSAFLMRAPEVYHLPIWKWIRKGDKPSEAPSDFDSY